MEKTSEGINLLLFFLIAFAWSWFFWFLQMLGLNLYVAPFGPFVVAFLLTYIQEGYGGVKKLLVKGFNPRIGKVWYVPALLLWPISAGFSILGASLTGESIPELVTLSQPWLILWNFVYIFLAVLFKRSSDGEATLYPHYRRNATRLFQA